MVPFVAGVTDRFNSRPWASTRGNKILWFALVRRVASEVAKAELVDVAKVHRPWKALGVPKSVKGGQVRPTVAKCSTLQACSRTYVDGKVTMSTTATQRNKTAQVRELSKDQARRMFDRQAKRYLNMTGPQFIEKWDAGKFNGKTDTPAVIRVAMLLPFGR